MHISKTYKPGIHLEIDVCIHYTRSSWNKNLPDADTGEIDIRIRVGDLEHNASASVSARSEIQWGIP